MSTILVCSSPLLWISCFPPLGFGFMHPLCAQRRRAAAGSPVPVYEACLILSTHWSVSSSTSTPHSPWSQQVVSMHTVRMPLAVIVAGWI
ncbi:hypothetical protein K438DRAFT_1257420 [Mycena galopus ATCC 62051]|nr:hypothetical protein K438DRAFT_1257420 [Mycena galopus ATCC 62051]